MKNGREVRPNGNCITKVKTKRGVVQYYVETKNGDPSKNGPWDYLYNARKDADSLGECVP